VSVYS
jgi:hypothetical protein